MQDERDDGGRIELYREGASWRFRIACGEETLAVSEDYPDAAAATRGIDLVRRGEVQLRACMSADGRFYFVCLADSGQRLATSPMFAAPSDRDAAQTRVGRIVREALTVRTIA
jgi:uncharacterized protein YegP (UPF0339 family)